MKNILTFIGAGWLGFSLGRFAKLSPFENWQWWAIFLPVTIIFISARVVSELENRKK